jgi:hypothetical protein
MKSLHNNPADLITLSEAAKLLGVSRPKMSRLVGSGKLATFDDPLDERAKLVSRQDVLALKVRAKAA